MALLAVDGHHGIERGPAVETQLGGVLDGLVELVVTVDEQLARHLRPGRRHVERQAVGLGVPIGHAAVLLAREALGTDVQARVDARVGLQQHEDAEADTLLGGIVAPDFDVATMPAGGPRGLLLFEQGVEPSGGTVGRYPARGGHQLPGLVVERRADARIFIKDSPLARLAVNGSRMADPLGLGIAPELGAVEHHALGPCHVEAAFLGTALHGVAVGSHGLPELLVVISIGVAHVGVDERRESDFGRLVEGPHRITDDAQLAALQREETHDFSLDLHARRHPHGHPPCEHRTPHVQLAAEREHLDAGQVERLAVDFHPHADPERRIEHLGEVFGITVLPPPHTRLVGIVNGAYVVALERFARIGLLEIGPAAHHAVAQREERFGRLDAGRVETLLDEQPRVGLDKLVHIGISQFGCVTSPA